MCGLDATDKVLGMNIFHPSNLMTEGKFPVDRFRDVNFHLALAGGYR